MLSNDGKKRASMVHEFNELSCHDYERKVFVWFLPRLAGWFLTVMVLTSKELCVHSNGFFWYGLRCTDFFFLLLELLWVMDI